MMEWHSDTNEPGPVGARAAIPHHVTLPLGTAATTDASTTGFRGSKVTTADGDVNVVRSSPDHVQVGFFPPSSSLETTNPTQLPGSRCEGKVITTPPLPASSSSVPSGAVKVPVMAAPGGHTKTESIEDVDRQRENYVPASAKDVVHGSSGNEGMDSPFCLPLPVLVDPLPESGGWRGEHEKHLQPYQAKRDRDISETAAVDRKRRESSVCSSEMSNISVSYAWPSL